MNAVAEISTNKQFETSLSQEELHLSTYFSVENEVERAQLQTSLGYPELQTKELLYINLRTTLEEFAGKVHNSKVEYIWDGYQIRAPGVVEPAVEMYKKWAEDTQGEREVADWQGIDKLQEGLRKGATAGFIISPPSVGKEGFGNYGFIYTYILKGDSLELHPIRYENEDKNLSRSNDIYSKIVENLPPDDSREVIESATSDETRFLQSPLLLRSENPTQAVSKVLLHLGYSQEVTDLEENVFTSTIKIKLSKWMSEFPELVMAASKAQNPDDKDFFTEEATRRLIACYTKAQEIKKQLDLVSISPLEIDFYLNHGYTTSRYGSDYDELVYYSQQKATVSGGGLCPAGKRTTNPLTNADILQESRGVVNFQAADLLTQNQNQNELKTECVTCPFCNEVVDALIEDGKLKCPSCNKKAGDSA